jgi:hypothetical protein
MFIAVLFTIAKLWKQPRCPTTDEWIKKIWYLYKMEFYSAMKKSEMDGTGEHHSEQGKPGSDDQKSYVLSYMWTLDLGQMQQCWWTWVMTRGEHIWEVWQ